MRNELPYSGLAYDIGAYEPDDLVLETAEGAVASFDNGADDLPLKSLVVNIEPKQSGSGDPSPDNVRPISGWSEVNVRHSGADQTNPTVYSIPFKDSQGNPITVYGGEIDVVSGEGKSTMAVVDLSTLNWSGSSGIALSTDISDIVKKPSASNIPANIIAEKYKASPVAPISANDGKIGIETSGRIQCGSSETPSGMLCFELATPTPIYCEPTEIKSLKGANNIWSDAGDANVRYLPQVEKNTFPYSGTKYYVGVFEPIEDEEATTDTPLNITPIDEPINLTPIDEPIDITPIEPIDEPIVLTETEEIDNG